MEINNILPSKMTEALEKIGVNTCKLVLILSDCDLKSLTNMKDDDIKLIKNLVSESICPEIDTGNSIYHQEKSQALILSGIPKLDRQLGGGFRTGEITEIFGESGSGKTQLSLQTCLHNSSRGCVYICTEDMFPSKRFSQMKQGTSTFNTTDVGKNIFVEHIIESNDLLSCVRVRLPILLLRNKLALIVIDSVAAPYRCEITNYIQRAEELRELAVALINIAQEFKVAIICINQITGGDRATSDIPSLGLAWSNMVSNRLSLKKSNTKFCNPKTIAKADLRELSVMFSPYLTNFKIELIISSSGIHTAD